MEPTALWLNAAFVLLGLAALSCALLAHLVEMPGLGGDHLRTRTAMFGCSSACRTNRTSSAPSTTCMDMRDDTTSADRTPSAALDESMVCTDSCMQVPCASCRGSTGSNCFELFSSMPVLHRVRCAATTSTSARI